MQSCEQVDGAVPAAPEDPLALQRDPLDAPLVDEDPAVAQPTTAGAAEENEEGEGDEDEEGCGPSFFEEEAQCKELLAKLTALLPTGQDACLPCNGSKTVHLLLSLGQEPAGAAALVSSLTKILDRYQESPHLLYPHLESLVAPLVALLLRYLPSASDVWAYERVMQASAQETKEKEGNGSACVAEETSTLGRNYDMFDADAPKTPIHLVCHALYTIVKTAGEKACTSHFPNGVQHYEDVFYALRLWKNTDEATAKATADGIEDSTGASWAAVRKREWEVRYCLLLWLCNLVLVPFSLSTIDSIPIAATSAATTTQGTVSSGRLTSVDSLSDAVLVTAVQFLADSSKCRDGAALLVARLLTRPDSSRHRHAFFGYAEALVAATVAAGGVVVTAAEDPYRQLNFLTKALAADAAAHPALQALYQFQNTFLIPGVLSALSKALKLGQRSEMQPYAESLIPGVAQLLPLRTSDALLCKTAVKVVQRLVLAMLPNKSASWKYTRSDIASLAANLQQQQQGQPANSQASKMHGGRKEENEKEEDEEGVIEGDAEVLEEGVGLLLQTLAHKDTIVRWSSAKGIGRVCDRLSADLAGEVVDAVFDYCRDTTNDAGWHGGLLALAELCRRSIIDVAGLGRVVSAIQTGLKFDLSKGTYSVGAHVRDAACYTCWSIARAYDAADLEAHVHSLSAALVVAALYDREVNVRRAAAAAFQECVGRLGSFPNGIALVTAMDFFSLASRPNAFLQVASVVAQHDAYRGAMLKALKDTKLLHWDINVRRCAAESLGRIVAIEYERCASKEEGRRTIDAIVAELQSSVTNAAVSTRHGAILGLAELVRGGLPPAFWTESQLGELADVLVRVDQARLFRSRGGEHVRAACCQLLTACAATRLPLPEFVLVTKLSGDKAKARTLGKMQAFLEETWRNILEWLQLAAAETFAAVAEAYYSSGFQPAFHGKVMGTMLGATAPAADGSDGSASASGGAASSKVTPLERRGFLAAMGGLPTCLLTGTRPVVSGEGKEEPYFLPIVRHLCAAALEGTGSAPPPATAPTAAESYPQQQLQESGDAESRRNAVCSLAKVLAKLPVDHPQLTPALYQDILGGTLLAALQDYAVDKRGDVGSFVRIATLQSLVVVVRVGLARPALLLEQQSSPSPSEEEEPSAQQRQPLAVRVLQGAVKASMEKLDRVRGAACAVLLDLLVTDTEFMKVVFASSSSAAATETRYLQSVLVELQSRPDMVWSAPSLVLPALGPALLCHTPHVYAQPAMDGLVLSAGDLSLHVQQPGTQALLSAYRGADTADAAATGLRLSLLTAHVGGRFPHTERVLIPLSRVLDRLLNDGVLAEATHPVCVTLLRAELKHYATAIVVVLPLVAVLATLCRSGHDGARQDAWALALTMVASRYPTVRTRMATDLYTALLVYTASPEAARHGDAFLAGCAAAMNLLLKTQWDSTDAGKVRGARNELYGMLGVAPPAKATDDMRGAAGDGTSRPVRAKVASSYAALVQEAGY